MKKSLALIALLGFAALAQAKSLTLYSGRSEGLVEPIIQQFQKETGLKVYVKYGRDAELLAALQEEGGRSPADLFWANTAGLLTESAKRGLFSKLPDTLLKKPLAFVPRDGLWVPTSARFRVLAYNPKTLKDSQLPASVLDLPKLSQFRGRIGWTPSYSSFQDFVTALRITVGEARAKQWLLDMKNLSPKSYADNTVMLGALKAGEIDIALTNHYYVQRMIAGVAEGEFEGKETEEPKSAKPTPAVLGTHYFAAGDVGNLELVTGAGLLKTSKHSAEAIQFLNYLLSSSTQQRIANSILEYPVIAGFPLPKTLLPLSEALKRSPKIDFARLTDLQGSLNLLRAIGLL